MPQRPPRGSDDLIADGTVPYQMLPEELVEVIQTRHALERRRDRAHEPLGQSRKDEQRVDHEPPCVGTMRWVASMAYRRLTPVADSCANTRPPAIRACRFVVDT